MKKRRSTIYMAIVLFSVAMITGCDSQDEALPKPSDQSRLSPDQVAAIHAEADRIAAAEVERLKNSPGARNPNGYDFIGLDVTGVTGTGGTSANYSFSSGVRSPALLNPGSVSSYNYLFCAAPSHFRYVVVYFYNGYSHTATTVGSIFGPTGGCLVGNTSFTASIGGPNSSQTFVVVFDVLNGPGGGQTTIASTIWSNSRDLSYPSYHILNPGQYWF